VYGANDPILSGIPVTLSGIVNNNAISTWNGTVSINDIGNVVTTLSSLTRTAGETVSTSPYNITAVVFNALTGSAAGNYTVPNSFAVTPTLTIIAKALSGSIADQSKVYGTNDPTLSGIVVTLGGIVNSTINTWNGNVSVNDTSNVATTLSSLTRAAGEAVSGSPYNITAVVFNALTGSAAGNYTVPNSFAITPTLTIIAKALSGSIADQSKVYGANDPTLSAIPVTLGGIVNSTINTWNGNVNVNDTGNVATTLSSLTRAAGEAVSGSPYNITAVVFNALTGSAASNYTVPNSFAVTPTLTIIAKALSGSIADQSKVYGANDPTLSSIPVTLGGIVNNNAINTWNGTVSINDVGNVATTLASLTRDAGEAVTGSPYNITAVVYNTLTGTAAGNYTLANAFSNAPVLNITAKALSGSIADQSKVYGANDPALSGIPVTLGGIVNGTINTWNGNVSVNDTGNVATTLSSLTRAAGEAVSGSPYNISAVVFNALTGSAAGNYNLPNAFAVTPTLTIIAKALSGSIADQSKVYGANDPTLSGIAVTLGGIVNGTINTWNGNVSVNDTGNVATTLSSLTRAAGEAVSASPYNITAVVFNALTGSAAGNYSLPNSFAVTPTLTIIAKALSGSIADQSKVYGANDPTLSGIAVTLGGVVNNNAISTWNGTVSINDVGNVATTLASLTRDAGETVAASPYNITGVVYNALTGTAAGNYTLANAFSNAPVLNIIAKSLSGSIADQSKVYGANDPTLSGIAVTLGGVVNNNAINTWNGTVSINDVGQVATTLASLTRAAGETVSSSPYNITAVVFNALTGNAAGNYSLPNSFAVTPTLTIIAKALSGSIADQSKVYGTNDPTLSGIPVTLGGIVNGTINTWNGNVNVNDTGNVATTLSSLARAAGEAVSGSPYNITAVVYNVLTGTAAGNYTLANAFSNAPVLNIIAKALSGSIADQSKVYGANDPTLSGIAVTLGGVVNNNAINTWNGTVSINDVGNVATTLTSLTRDAGETVSASPYNITGVVYNALTGTAAGNYTLANTFSNAPVLNIIAKALSGSITDQSKVYGANDPALSGIAVTLGGIVNGTINTWNGNVSVNDTGNVATTLSSLARAAGETVSGSPYSITAVVFNALTGSAAGNYTLPNSFTVTPTLTITPQALSGAIANQSKVYGTNDPILSGISVTLGGIVNNNAISTWNGTVSIDDIGNVATTLSSLTRAAGETVSASPYNITAVIFNALTGSAAGNYSLPNSFAVTPTLTITPQALSGSIADQSKVYGANDPVLSGIAVTLGGIVNGTINTWNGNVSVNDTGNVATTLSSLTRTAGETVSGSPYNITAVVFNALAGSAAGNYSLPNSFAVTPTLTIIAKALSGSIADQSKVYGANDPALSGMAVTLDGIVNGTINTWNGNVNVNDTGNVATTLSSLTRAAGETVSGSPYNITAVVFNALTGSAAGNYTVPNSFAVTPTLTIIAKALSGSIADQSKIYGANDPAMSGIAVTLGGVVNNNAISTWNGTVSINDVGHVATTLASLTRDAGEIVSASPYNITGVVYNALTGTAAGNYTLANAFSNAPVLNIIAKSLSGSIADQSKVYGANDPTLSGIAVTLDGVVNNNAISTWNGTVSINDVGHVATTLASLTRDAGEIVSASPYNITGVVYNVLTGTAAGNYTLANAFSNAPVLNIIAKALSGSITDQSKVYGANDPALSGIAVTLGGVVNNNAISTWNGTVSINDVGHVATTLASLTRDAGETVSVSPYNITGVVFNTLTGTAASNYSLPNSFAVTPVLNITAKSLSATIANQTKVYGNNDPAISSISVVFSGVVNNPAISTWNGNVSVNDTGNVITTLATIARNAGESVSNSPYAITSATFNALTGSAAGNYVAPSVFTGSPTLTITAASLTASISNLTKVYGTNDPAAAGIPVTLGGIVDQSNIYTWNGNVNINDTGLVNVGLTSYARTAGENVINSPYAITGAVFNALTGSAASNYSAPTNLTGSPTLSITTAPLTVNANTASKVYGVNDPTFTYNATGFINAIVDGTPINDNAANSLTGALNRTITSQVDENVGPHTILQGTLASSNYAITYNSANLTITPATLTINGNAANKVYGTNDSVFTYQQNGLVNGMVDGILIQDTLSGGLARTINASTENVGAYPILQGTLSASSNYTMQYHGANETITTAPLTVSANQQTKVYGTTDPALTYVQNGLVNGVVDGILIQDTFSGALARAAGNNVGNYLINQGTLSAGSNYNMSFNTNNFAITPASLIVANAIANNKIFDKNTATTLDLSAAQLNGIVGSDAVNINSNNYNANFVTPTVGNNKSVVVTNLGLTGASASNYTLVQPQLTADILPSPADQGGCQCVHTRCTGSH